MEPSSLDAHWDLGRAELLARLQATPDGLTTDEAHRRLRTFGTNEIVSEERIAPVIQFLRLLGNPLVLILLFAAVVSFALGERVSALLIVTIVLISVSLDFYQVYQAQRAVQDLRQQVALTSTVLRDGRKQVVQVAEIVPGDIVELSAGALVPADGRLLEEKDLFVRESALTGESLPVEKDPADLPEGHHGIGEARNTVFFGTSVQSGVATAIVVSTGRKTEFGAVAAKLAEREPETEFDRGIRRFGLLLVRVIFVLVLFVFLVNVLFHRPMLQSFLFALALAVGLTPELLPVIITVTLSRGAKRMASRKVLVKQLAAIENFGSIEVLCSDKTGTLTLGEVTLQKHVDVEGNENARVLQTLYLNSYFETSLTNPLDEAVLRHKHPDIGAYKKLDEIPFDFERRRLSVVVEREGKRSLVAKGSVKDITAVCTSVDIAGSIVPLDDKHRTTATATFERLSEDGYRVLAVAARDVPEQASYDGSFERDMTLVGFAAFLDPPKDDARETLQALARDDIQVLVMTGDNHLVTRKVAEGVGLPADNIVVGTQVDTMDAAALAHAAEHGAIFAEVSPEQKDRIITALRSAGRVVGFLGDGINDAPSLHAADVGISVSTGTDVAKDAANIILLEKSLAVLHEGVLEGRRSFANVMKYIVMGTSSNFGNMFSMAAASLFLPFLPMLPQQILLNNLLYDASQIAIPTDNVDAELLRRPKRWHTDFIREFMFIIGPVSSVYDFLTFGVLLYFFHANESLFHTGWFVESLATQTLVVFVIRTAGNPFASRPSRRLTFTVLAVVFVAFVLPYMPFAKLIGFVALPWTLVLAIIGLTATYLVVVQVVKHWFYRRHELI